MRDLSALLAPRSRDELRARIPSPERFRPEPRVVRPIQVRPRDDGKSEVLLERTGKWARIHPLLVETVRALQDGCTVEETVARGLPLCPRPNPRLCERLVRNFVWRLHQEGSVELVFEEPPGSFAGRYRRLRELGRGGMGVVHLCADEERGGAPVVIKHAWGWSKPIERAEATIRSEVAVLARLAHPRIPALVDAFEVDGLLHMVREYAPGQSITKLRPRPRELAPEARLRLVGHVASALQHLHEAGYLYLDVKPGNIMAEGPDAPPSLLDFGICRPLREGRVALRKPAGSRGYAAPEVVAGSPATPASDVYSLGRVHFHLATGLAPKHAWRAADLAQRLDEAGVSGRERDLVLRMAADAPEARPAMAEVAAEAA